MASGHLYLLLSETVNWEEFPDYAETLLRKLDGKVLTKADSVCERVWIVEVDGVTVWLSHGDYPADVTIESMNDDGAALVVDLARRLFADSNQA